MWQSYCSFSAHTHVIQNGLADPNIRPQASMRLILLRTPSKSSAKKRLRWRHSFENWECITLHRGSR